MADTLTTERGGAIGRNVLGAAQYVQGDPGKPFERHAMDDPEVMWHIFGVRD